ncbi:ATP-binding protein [candidate division KSB1 bacterium]
MKEKTLSFRTRARVINQLGEQLIKNESIALLELIKNSYDADASMCDVQIINPSSIEKGEIIIWDNGEGMDYDTLSKVWMEIGTSYKEDLRKDSSKGRSPKFKRHRLGEKGIGRLGVHRLGKEIEITTKSEKSQELILRLDWNDIERSVYIEDLPAKILRGDSNEFDEETGTKIRIRNLRVPWTRKMARDCARSIMSLNSPFESDESFRTSFRVLGTNWLEGLLTFSEIEQYKLFSFDILMSGNEIEEFTYEFIPWDTMKKLSCRKLTDNDKEINALLKMVRKDSTEYRNIDLDLFEIGDVRFKGIIFDRDTRTFDLGVQDRTGLKKYLNENGGIRVFRDNMRVLDYGDAGNDWLDLGGRRINMPTKRISNNIILGAVYLDREHSAGLIEKANREGFVENNAYWELFYAIRFAIHRIESLRKTDKDLLRKHYGPQKTSEPVTTSITELKDVVNKNVKDDSTRMKIHVYLDRIENEYDEITNSLIKSAGAGLNLIIVIHQIGKIINEIKSMLKQKASALILEDRVKVLSSLVEGYSILIKKSEKKSRNLKKIIEQSVFNMEFRLETHDITLESFYEKHSRNLSAICSVDHVLNALMNIFDNSIWWLGYSKTKHPSIFLDISEDLTDYISIIVADNGPGFTKPTDEIIKPFVSDKPGGMGIGLHLTHQIMESLGGKLIFPETEIFNISEKYKKGAVVALAFRKGVG